MVCNMEEFITAKEASKELGCGLKKVYSFINNGSITLFDGKTKSDKRAVFYKRRDVDRLKKLIPGKIGRTAHMPPDNLPDDMPVSIFEAVTMCCIKTSTMDMAIKTGVIRPEFSCVTVGVMREFMKEYLENGSDIHRLIRNRGMDPKKYSKEACRKASVTDEDPYINIVGAIIGSAYADYVKFLSGEDIPMYTMRNGKWVDSKETEKSFEDFFYGEWFDALSNTEISGKYIMDRAKKEAGIRNYKWKDETNKHEH